MEPQYVGLTQRGRRKVIQNGYAYVKEKDGPGTVSYWRCERKDELRCKGRMKMDGDLLVTTTGVHCHGPDPLKDPEQATSERQLERLAAGHPGRRKTYEDCDKRLRTLIYTFEQRPAPEFLRGVAQKPGIQCC